MIWILFVLALSYTLWSALAATEDSAGLELAYRCLRERFWLQATGAPAYRPGTPTL